MRPRIPDVKSLIFDSQCRVDGCRWNRYGIYCIKRTERWGANFFGLSADGTCLDYETEVSANANANAS